MKVRELMQTDVKTVEVDATVGDAITTLADAHVSALPVTDNHGRIVGVVSTTDILCNLAETTEPDARERLFDETPVREIMTSRSRVIAPDAEVLDAARAMLGLDVHRLFVEEHGRLVGVLSQTDIVAAVATVQV